MRTTINLEPESERAVAELRRTEGLGLSEAVNTLIRRGATSSRTDYVYPCKAFVMGARVPVDRTGEVLDLLDEAERR